MSPITFRRKTIRRDKTFGEQLREARISLKFTIAEAEQATRVRGKYLLALEDGAYQELPEDVYTLGFVRRYAQFLHLDTILLTNLYRQEQLAAHKLGWVATKKGQPAQLKLAQPLREPRVVITPKLFWLTSSFVVIIGIAGYIWYQVQGFMAAPDLELAVPRPDLIVSSPTIEIVGQTDGYAYVTINAEPVSTDPEGKFAQEVRLAPGVNLIAITARNRLNKETTKQIRVLADFTAQVEAAGAVQ